jgi:two-component system OmpR family sensor kinase
MRRALASLTSRLVLVTVALVAVVAVVLGLATTLILHGYLQRQLDEKVQASLQRTLNTPNYSLGGPGPNADPDQDGDIFGQSVGTLTAYWNGVQSLGQVITTGSHQRARYQRLSSAQLARLSTVSGDQQPHTVQVSGLGTYRVVAVTGGGARLLVGLPTSDVDATVSSVVGWEIVLVLAGTAGAGAAGWFVVRRQMRPLREVASTAQAVATLPLAEEVAIAQRVPERLTDERTEVGQVGSALNTLLVHVESSLAQRHRSEQQVRQFVADASHELRTPLTTIAGYTELARRRPDDAATARTALGKVEEESARMTAMVEDLLLLARLDAGRPLASDTVDLSRLLVEAVSDARVVAPDHRWRLDLPEDSLEVPGDADRLHQVVTNLLTNARKHTPAGTTVTVTGTVTSTGHGFSVHDDGPGFPPDLAASAFERFVRGDASRTRTAGTAGGADGTYEGGAGLGLALVHAIVTAHGGSVTLDTRPGSTTIPVALPG